MISSPSLDLSLDSRVTGCYLDDGILGSQVREMRHENINPFIGASVDTGNICILSLYCARGSLEVSPLSSLDPQDGPEVRTLAAAPDFAVPAGFHPIISSGNPPLFAVSMITFPSRGEQEIRRFLSFDLTLFPLFLLLFTPELKDILMNEDFEQVMGDTMFVASLVADLIKVRIR